MVRGGGNFNAKAGNHPQDQVIVGYRLGKRNDVGDKTVGWAKSRNTVVGNTGTSNIYEGCSTWTSSDNETGNQTNCVLIKRRFRNAL